MQKGMGFGAKARVEGMHVRTITLEGAANVRDLGGIDAGEGLSVKQGLFYRGDALNGLTDQGARDLSQKYRVSCIIDLRCGWEREKRPDKDIFGVENLHMPFYDLEKTGIEYTKSIPGSKVTGHDIVCDPDDFYRSMPNLLTSKMAAKALEEIFSRAASGQAVYEHCSGGKDRAGIMALLILSILGVSREGILEDYLLTNANRDKNIAPVFERFKTLMGGDEDLAWKVTENHRARPENLVAYYESVDERYGSMDDYLSGCLGFDEERRRALRAKFTIPRA